jgi:hypothetical protein
LLELLGRLYFFQCSFLLEQNDVVYTLSYFVRKKELKRLGTSMYMLHTQMVRKEGEGVSKELEKALETWANSRKEGHEQFIQLFEQWGKNFDKQIQEIEKLNNQFLKDVQGNLDYINKWFAKKENEFAKLFRIFG